MSDGQGPERQFAWLWAAHGTSALGAWLAFGAFPLIAIQVLHAGPAQVAALAGAREPPWARPRRYRSASGWSSGASAR